MKKATVDFTSVIGCQLGRRQLHCRVQVLQKGSGEQAYKLIPIPYHSNNRTLQVEFADDLVFKKGSGLILGISTCDKIQDAFRCDNPDFEANYCLEELEARTSLEEVPDSCKVIEIPANRPLLVPVEEGHLIAQRSDVPLAIEYGDKTVPDNPVIISNKKEIAVTFGKQKFPHFYKMLQIHTFPLLGTILYWLMLLDILTGRNGGNIGKNSSQ